MCIMGNHSIIYRGVFRYSNCYPAAIAMIASGKVNVRPLITHTFPLKDSVKAFETAKNFSSELPKSSGAIKVLIKCNGNSNTGA